MPLLPSPSSSSWPSVSTSSDPLYGERLEALARSFAFHPLTIVPLASGRLAIVSGRGSREFEFSCEPLELGLVLHTGLHMVIDNTPAPCYPIQTEQSLGITIEL